MKPLILKQERKHLKSVIEEITDLIIDAEKSSNLNRTDKKSDTKDNYYAVVESKINRSYHMSRAIKYAQFIPNPYFCRIFYVDKDGIESNHYFTKNNQPIWGKNNKLLALTWRDNDFAVDSLQSGDVEIDVKGKHYRAFLKRDFTIKQSELIKYDESGSGGDNDVTDSFLKELLEEKKNDYRLTDIIRSIQKKQSQIIRLNTGKSFIVQGCAGSGKTMILLHRLSVIKYNISNINWNYVKIITPSKLFDVHIRKLLVDLDIDNITPISIPEYYLNLLQRYEQEFKNSDFTLRYSIQYNSVQPLIDGNINDEFLNVVYSIDFRKLCESLFSKYLSDVIISGCLNKIEQICNRHEYKIEINYGLNERYVGDKYRKYFSDIVEHQKTMKDIEEKGNILYNASYITQKERKTIDEVSDLFNPKAIINFTINYLVEELSEKFELKIKKTKYSKFRLYLHLVFWYWFGGSLINKDNQIHIDEGQDILLSEYKLLSDINNKTVFNIYGDVNQLINHNKGIDNWDVLREQIKECEFFEINENYRNTIEITEYCNNFFELGTEAIGKINGECVREISIETLIVELKDLLRTTESVLKRIAIIAKSDSILDLIHEQLDNTIEIEFLTVQSAKGLEFDIVYVLNQALTKNEKYIAYTRALGQLIVVNGEMTKEVTIDNDYFSDLVDKFSKTNRERLRKT